jgi:hypothetical protein
MITTFYGDIKIILKFWKDLYKVYNMLIIISNTLHFATVAGRELINLPLLVLCC